MNTKQTLIHNLKSAIDHVNGNNPESVNAFEIAFEALQNYVKAEEALNRLSKRERQYLCMQVLNL